MQKFIKNLFFVLVCVSVTAALWVFKDFLFPFVTSKAFFFRIAIEAAFPLYLYLLVSEPKLRPNLKNPLNFTVLVFLVINLASSFTGVSLVRSMWGNFERMGGAYYLAHLVALYFFVLCLGQMQDQYLQRFLKVLLLVAFVVTGNGIFGWLHLPTFVQDPSLPGRVSSTLGNPIYLGSFLIVPIYLSLFFGIQADKLWAKIFYFVLSAMFLWGVFLSGTRGAVVGVIFGSFLCAVFYVFLTPSKKIRSIGIPAAIVFVVLAGLLFTFSSKLPAGSTVQRIFKLQDSNTEARLIQWKTALTGYKDHPILGTGPENYYIIANKYYNPQIFQYDRSWFDKPHNYLLEILVTNGILGFVAYLGMLGFLFIALYKGYKADFYGPLEFCVLLAGLIVYQIQNLTVFDTVPASLMFYGFLGFGGYLWSLSNSFTAKKDKTSNKPSVKNLVGGYGQGLAWAVLAVSLVVSAYAIYATNAVPMAVAANVNYGYAYASVDPAKADDYFNNATTLPFNFDKSETASRFADFATTFVRAADSKNQALANKVLEDSINYMQVALSVHGDNPILWQRLSLLYLYKSLLGGSSTGYSPLAEDAVNHVVALAPNREESYSSEAQILGLKGQLDPAAKVLEKAIIIFPSDPNLKIQLAQTYRLEGKVPDAVSLAEQALKQGYSFSSYLEMQWLVDYYEQNKQYAEAVKMVQLAAKAEPNNVQVFIELAKLYALTGQIDQAKALANNIIQVDPTKKADMQAFIASLGQTATTVPVK